MGAIFRYIRGDLLDSDDFYIVHCVNAQGAFGSGVAGAIAKKWPAVRQDYIDFIDTAQCQTDDRKEYYDFIGGNIIFSVTPDDAHNVVHLVGQKHFGSDGRKYVYYDWIYRGFSALKPFIGASTSISIPFLGCGLAGGSWNIIKAIIEEVFKDVDITINVYYLDAEERRKILGV